MLAVIRTGGKQYCVGIGDVVTIERLALEPEQKCVFDDILLIADGDERLLDASELEGAMVEAELVSHERGNKIIIYKSRQRSTYRRKKGHRQRLSSVRITAIVPGSGGEN